jgi:hypothetical protein
MSTSVGEGGDGDENEDEDEDEGADCIEPFCIKDALVAVGDG